MNKKVCENCTEACKCGACLNDPGGASYIKCIGHCIECPFYSERTTKIAFYNLAVRACADLAPGEVYALAKERSASSKIRQAIIQKDDKLYILSEEDVAIKPDTDRILAFVEVPKDS